MTKTRGEERGTRDRDRKNIPLTDLAPHRIRPETLAGTIGERPNGRIVWRAWAGGRQGYRFLPSRGATPKNHRPIRSLITLLTSRTFGLDENAAGQVVARLNADRLAARRRSVKTGEVAI